MVSVLQPIYPREQILQHTPTVIILVTLALEARRDRMSLASAICVVLFLWLHILGARYIYSFVPYDDWSRFLFDSSVSEWFRWKRNHYDRLVHFLFGALFVIPATELGRKCGRMSRLWSVTFGVLVVVSLGAIYEIFEWLLSVIMAPHQAEAYNGQQGDLWDAQKDMALAFVGALGTVVFLAARELHRRSIDQ